MISKLDAICIDIDVTLSSRLFIKEAFRAYTIFAST